MDVLVPSANVLHVESLVEYLSLLPVILARRVAGADYDSATCVFPDVAVTVPTLYGAVAVVVETDSE